MRVHVCGGFTQRGPGWRALRWLVKPPLRAFGFELAFCQLSCQKEAEQPERERVCVSVSYFCEGCFRPGNGGNFAP